MRIGVPACRRAEAQHILPTRAAWARARAAFLALMIAALCGCGRIPVQHFQGSAPRLEPEQFFLGPVHSWGVIEDRGGNPTARFRTSSEGRREGADLVLTQNFEFENGRRQQRIWRLHRLDDHRYEARAGDVIGTAHGEAYGNAFRWEYTLALDPGNWFKNVRMHHWMYLVDDGTTLVNRVIITKLGVRMAQITEYFRHGTTATLTSIAAP